MAEVRDALEELESAYSLHQRMEKSRKKAMDKGAQGGSDNPPADPDNMGRYDSDEQEDKDNQEEMDAQYGDTEPQDGADKRATKEAARRQKRVVEDTRKSRRDHDEDEDDDGRKEEEDIQKCRKCKSEVEKGQKFCHNCGESLKKSKGSATRAVRDSQDSYLRDDDEDDDDLHGEAEDMGEEEGRGDDKTIITNMGRRTKPKVTKSRRQEFYEDLYKSGAANDALFDANPTLEVLADTIGDYLAQSESKQATLAKSNNALAKSNREISDGLNKSMRAQAALLRTVTNLQQQLDNLVAAPADQPYSGIPNFTPQNVVPIAKSGARGQQQAKLSKSLVRDRLIKGMRDDVVESGLVADFDESMGRGLTADQWAEAALTDDVRQALGL